MVIGPESTGKSTLCRQLADYYQTDWVPEYARAYLLENGTDYNYTDLYHIGKNQLRLEDEYAAKTQKELLFIDTDMYVMKVWCEVVFGKVHPFIHEEIKQRKYDLYLLCNTDLPWVKDELREYPDIKMRESLFMKYYNLMQNQQVPWKVIKGNYEERLSSAIEAVEKLQKNMQ